ncbi:hypothetical protein DdX_15632 [Ditylenchus destructor]|uniref:F-box domain-containing protein n=1 Tax=Ditylenchus destructor TaxID=166010 RepID=A0AAD4MUN5_9BILA|nr:hypothetical protein DdX_15632 [Ditylenchus destructor]
MDNGTMVEAFKYLNYSQLAKKSLVSKRFRNLIQTHRHQLALLYVKWISMHSSQIEPATIKIFGIKISSEAYNEWVIRNNYSKQAPLEVQIAGTQSTQNIPNGYWLIAHAYYNDPNRCISTSVFYAHVNLSHENWPLFQHFVRLVTDPFIYIDSAQLAYQNDILNLLSETINSDRDRLQCKELYFDLNADSHSFKNFNANIQKFITWAKDSVRCNQFSLHCKADFNHDEAFFDLFLTGAHCTRSIKIVYVGRSTVLVNFVQKFMDLKTCDECQLVEAIEGSFRTQALEMLKQKFAVFIVNEERRHNTHIFELVNNNIGKKLQLTTVKRSDLWSSVSIKIINL